MIELQYGIIISSHDRTSILIRKIYVIYVCPRPRSDGRSSRLVAMHLDSVGRKILH